MRIRPINKFVRIFVGCIIGGFDGVSLCPFGIYINDKNIYVLNHEKIHWRQQLEMLIVPFYIWYFIELIIRRINHNKFDAYVLLGFEKEAYQNQYNLNYLRKRKPYAWVKYLKIKEHGGTT